MANYPSNFIGPLPVGQKKDVSFDDGEMDAFYGSTPKANEAVSYDKSSGSYKQGQKPMVLGDSDKGGFDASAYAKSLGYKTTGAARSALGVSSLQDYYKQYGSNAKSALDAQKSQANKIGKAWDPIFSELDRQLGSIPSRQADYEKRIASSAEGQMSEVDRSREQGIQTLETEKARGLRDLEGDIRNQIDAAGRKIGVAGAGSSSAVGQASEAIARVGQKARGGLLETVATKLTDIQNLASEQKAKIGTWRDDKLFEITNFFANKMDELSSQKAGAQKERKQAITQLEMQAEQEYVNALRQLDSTIVNYAQSVDMWEKQRAAELQDYSMRQGNNSQVAPQEINAAVGAFNTLLENGYSAQEAEAYLNAQGIALPSGLSGQGDTTKPEYDIYQDDNGQTFYFDKNNPQAGFIPMSGMESPSQGLFNDNLPLVGRF